MTYPYEVLPNTPENAQKLGWGHVLEHCVGDITLPWVIHDTDRGKFVFSPHPPSNMAIYRTKPETLPYEGLCNVMRTGLIENDQFATIPCPPEILAAMGKRVADIEFSMKNRLHASKVSSRTGLPVSGSSDHAGL